MGEAGVIRHFSAALAALSFVLAGCSIGASGFATDFQTVKTGAVEVSTARGPEIALGESRVGKDGRCEGADSIDPASLRPLGPKGIPLGTRECEVVARMGGPYSVEVKRGPAGERLVTLMYVSGPKIGVYHFVNDKLVSVEH
jgi:hypothetical protein